MNRNLSFEGIILFQKKSGENDRWIQLFTPGQGILSVMAFGAQKSNSQLRGVTQIYQYGVFHLYHNQQKKQMSLREAEIKIPFQHISEDLNRFYTASLWSELIIRTHGGGGDHTGSFSLFLSAVTLLDSLEEKESSLFLNLQFLLRYLLHLGYLPELQNCPGCSTIIHEGDFLYYLRSIHSLVCKNCAVHSGFCLNPGMRKYIERSLQYDWDQALRIRLVETDAQTLKTWLLEFWQHLLGWPLKTLIGAEGLI